jgi:ABC-type dipeptide/oligopeptide/nickel transport system ATPase subunit
MLQITDLSARVAGRLLIDHASLTLPTGTKAGLVGRNGAGKSTLFRVITGDLAAETGSVSFPKNTRLGQVAQEAPGTEEPLIEIVLKADLERVALLAEAETATDPTRIADIHVRLADIDAHSAEARASAILSGLGFDMAAQARRPRPSPAAGGCASRWRRCCSRGPTSCCSTSRRTISIWRERSGWRTSSRAIPIRCWSSATTATCSTTP